MKNLVQVLFVEDNPGDARLVKEELAQAGAATEIELTCVDRLAKGLEHVAANHTDAILLDLSLPDSSGLETLERFLEAAPSLPVIVMTGMADEKLATKAVQAGAQDYLFKGQVDGQLLKRSIRYAIERKRAQETLRESEDKIQNLIRHSSSMFYTHNTEHTLTYVGPQSREILDCEPEEAMVRWQEFLSDHPVNQQGIEFTERAIRTARRQPPYELELITKANRKVWVQVDESPVVQDGKTVAIVGSLTDITARKSAEEKLRESEERFRALIENSNDAIALLDVNGTILFESPAGSRILGFSRAELVGRSALEMLHPDDEERVSALFDRLVDSNLNLKAEFRFQHKDGSWRWVETIGTNMLEVPAVHAIVINYRDTTERKQAEEKIVFQANLLAAVGSAVIATDAEGRVQYWNSAAESMYGWSSTEALGKSVSELMPALQSLEEAQVIMDRLAQGKSWSGDFLVQRKDGKTFPAFVANSPILDSDGNLAGIIGVSNDISELKQAQAEIAASQRRFEALIDHAPDGIALLGLDGKLQQVTPSTEHILGYSLEDARDQDPAQLTHPDDLPGLLGLLDDLAQHPGKTVKTHYRFRHKDGSWRWLESTISNLGAEPSVGAIIFNYRDVTEQKKLERDKQERIKELTCLYEILKDFQENISPDKLCEHMMTHLIQGMQFPHLTAVRIELNERTFTSELYSPKLDHGLHAEIVQGNTLVGKLSVYYTEDRPFIYPEEANLIESVANLLGKWLSQKEAESALKESEEEYRSLFEDSPIALWVEDYSAVKQRLDGLLQDDVQDVAAFLHEHPEIVRECADLVEILDVNTSAMMLYQAKRKDDLLGKLSEVFKFLSIEQFEREVTHIASGILNFDLENVDRTLTGKQINVQSRWSVVPGHEDSLARVIVSTVDVTERKQAEEEIHSRTEDLLMLYTLSRSLADADDLQTILDLICQYAAKGVNTTFARLALVERDELAVQAVYPIRNLDFSLSLGEHRPIISLPHCQRILEEHDPIVLQSADASIGGEERNVLLLDQVNELCLIPLWLKSSASQTGQALGLLMLGEARSREREPFSADKLRLTQSIANLAANAITRIRLHDQTLLQLQRLSALHVIDQAINSSMDLRLSLKVLLEQVAKQLSVDAADVLVLRRGLNHLEYAAGHGFRATKITRSFVRLGEPYAGQVARERQMLSIQNLEKSNPSFAWSDVIGGEDFVSYYAVPLIAKGQVKGVLEIFHRASLDPDPEWFAYLETLAGQAAIAIDNSELYEGLQRSNIELRMAYDTTIEGWSKALDLRDKETEGHTQRVTDLTQQMARAMDFNEEDIKHIRHGALLHDIGKMGIPDNILLKPGALDEEEWKIMKKHPVFAYELLAPISYLRPALDIPYCHHEKWDGTGYPRGLKGDQIPLSARIFSIIDVWDALTSDRPYREAWPKEKALDYIKEQSGKHFDPQVVQVFLEIIA